MTMLEDDLREMFNARVQAPPAANDPAGLAVREGRANRARRRILVGGIGAMTLAAVVAGTAMLKGGWAGGPGRPAGFTFEEYYGRDEKQTAPGVTLPIIDMPVDVFQGTTLWTTTGRQLTLPGVEQVVDVVRVPQGWLYSDDLRLRLLTIGGQSLRIRDNIRAWAVSADGGQVASVSGDSTLAVHSSAGDAGPSVSVPSGTRPTGFDGQRVIIKRDGGGTSHWSGNGPPGADADPYLLAVYGATNQTPVGFVAGEGRACLVELSASGESWLLGTQLGCAEMFNNAARAGTGLNRASRSPDGRWLAVPSPTGVHIVDIFASRAAGDLVFGYSCASSPDAPAVWASAAVVLTITGDNGVVACGVSGTKFAVALPAGVSDGWALVRRAGVSD